MRASTPEKATSEAKRFAQMLRKLFKPADTIDFKDASDFGQFFALEVMGYRDGELTIAWVQGFVSGILNQATQSELDQAKTGKEQLQKFLSGELSLDEFMRNVAALPAPADD